MDHQEAIGDGMMVKSIPILLALFLVVTPALAAGDVVLVVGAPGTPEYGETFAESAASWREAAEEGGVNLSEIGIGEVGETGDLAMLEEQIGALAGAGAAPLWVVLIGHGTFDGRLAKFNLRGEDLDAAMLAGWFEGCERPIAVINTSASSAPFIKALSAKGRVIVTATKSGFEDSYARFGQFLAASINAPEADIDQDGSTSLLEAFLAAAQLVQEFYEKDGRIATEQALIDDNGDGLGTPASFFRGTRAVKSAKDGSEPDGRRAHQWHLVPSEAERLLSDGARKRRDGLEEELFALRARKDTMEEVAYLDALEDIMRALAEIYKRDQDGSEAPADPDDSDDPDQG
ncbi:MAG: hypothetical protein ACR2RV_07115 [Verrucomicrobiales bacterium]